MGREQPEKIIREAIIKRLRYEGWFVTILHGNAYQMGLPDLYATHSLYGGRWIEVKNPVKYQFTQAQLQTFPKLVANGTNVYVLTGASDDQIACLFKLSNWHTFLL